MPMHLKIVVLNRQSTHTRSMMIVNLQSVLTVQVNGCSHSAVSWVLQYS